MSVHGPDRVSGRPDVVDERAQVMSVEKGAGGICRALLLAPRIARKAKPLQFVMVKVSAGADPYLRRPFGISLIEPDSGLIGITWSVVGRGTGIMAEWEPGQEVRALGPLGNGYVPGMPSTVTTEGATGGAARLFLVAGGTGLAPMLPLAVAAKTNGWRVALFHGARSAEYLLDTGVFADAGCDVSIATDDGSAGTRGFVTQLAAPALAAAGSRDVAVACGPTPMLRAVKSACAQAGVPLYVSLEERMACGTGLCKGCAVKAAASDRGYYHVCSDGPVFRAADVDLGGREPA